MTHARIALSFGERVRHQGFGAWDRMRGGPIAAHLAQLDRLQWAAPGDLRAWQDERLSRLLAHARCSTAFYHALVPARPQAEGVREKLAALPIVDRHVMKADRDRFVSRAVPAAARYEDHTSGSLGEPFAFFIDRRRRDRTFAETLYFMGLAGYEIGMRHAFLRILSWHPKSRFRQWVENQIILEPRDLDEAGLEGLCATLRRSRARILIGYPSVLGLVARHAASGSAGPFPFRAVVAIGELLLPEVRRSIESAFCCEVFERYSASEVGHIAGECEAHRLHVNVASLYVEFVPDGAPDGSCQVVVTDLVNYGMPFIRYALADRVVPGAGDCPCGRTSPTLKVVRGRANDWITQADGRPIDATGMAGIFYDLPQIRQFQVIQEAIDRYAVLVVPERTFTAHDAERLVQRGRRLLGAGAQIEVRCVEQISPLPSGKHAYVLSRLGPPKADPFPRKDER